MSGDEQMSDILTPIVFQLGIGVVGGFSTRIRSQEDS